MRLSRFSADGLSSNKTNDAKENENARTQIIVGAVRRRCMMLFIDIIYIGRHIDMILLSICILVMDISCFNFIISHVMLYTRSGV